MALPGWRYKRIITVDNSNNSNTLTDYQIRVVLDTASLISAGKMKSDGSDIRITDSDGRTLLNYWIEGINTSSTKIWVKVPSIPASSTKTIYLYYGNSNATSQSSTANTFIREIDGGQPLKGSWSFDEGTGTTTADSSGNNNNGTLVNGPTWVDGKFGKALSFDGVDDYLEVPVSTSLNITGPLTIEAWVYPKANGVNMVIVRAESQYTLWVQSDNEVRFADTLGNYVDTDPNVLTLNTWNHLVAVFNGTSGTTVTLTNALIYVNNISKGTHTSGTWSPSSLTNFFIGTHNSSSYFFKGIIDEVRIYNRALSSAEITDLYNNYGYTTTAYPGRVLVRKFSSPEPTTSVGYEIPLMGGGFLFNLV